MMTGQRPRGARAPIVQGWLLVLIVVIIAAHLAVSWQAPLSNDASMQWLQVRTNRLNDWHPPAMTRLWQFLGIFGTGPRPLLVFSILFYWSGIGLFAMTLMRLGKPMIAFAVVAASVIAVAVWFDPIGKDGLLTSCFIWSYALLLAARTRERASVPLIAIALLMVCCGVLMRHNGAFAAGPAVILAFAPRLLRRFWLSLGLCAIIAVALAGAVQVANRAVFRAESSRVEDSLLLFDLLGIASGSGDLTVFGPASRITKRDVTRCYSPVMWDTMAPWGKCPWFPEKAGAKLLDQPQMIAGAVPPPSDFKRRWIDAVAAHPVAYAVHRVRHMNAELLLLTSTKPRNGIVPVSPVELRNPPQDSLLTLIAKHTLGVIFIPAVVVALALSTFVILFVRLQRVEKSDAVLWTALSMSAAAVLYAGSYAIAGVATAPRYFLLTAVLASFALVIGIGDGAWRTFLRERRGLAMACLALPVLAIGLAEAGRMFVPIPPDSLQIPPR
ncbi:hypothetical protein [uncultured Novosphingobium sp.]|uniref:hypothetical protein n=1 Tax=uncultured Novosphingobium sp. TaxID=292277 RepID=UPI0025902C21|nr:hypothetical protein [uncultured Novosphingobium sp.]